MARTELKNHPKFKRFRKAMGIPKAHAVGLLELMWQSCYDTANDRLGSADDVEMAAEWTGKSGKFFEAAINCGEQADGQSGAGFVEPIPSKPGVYRVHDLFDWAPDYVKKKLARRKNKELREETADIGGQTAANGRMTQTQTSNRQRHNKDKDISDSSEPAQQASEQPGADASKFAFPSFPVVARSGKPNAWQLSKALISELAATYSGINVPAECRKAWEWVKCNPGRKKTAKGMPKFLNSWMSRAQDRVGGRQPMQSHESDLIIDAPYPTDSEVDDMFRKAGMK